MSKVINIIFALFIHYKSLWLATKKKRKPRAIFLTNQKCDWWTKPIVRSSFARVYLARHQLDGFTLPFDSNSSHSIYSNSTCKNRHHYEALAVWYKDLYGLHHLIAMSIISSWILIYQTWAIGLWDCECVIE